MAEADQKFKYLINGQAASTDDPTPTSEQILADAGFEPADDYLLIQRTRHGSKVVSNDDVLSAASGIPEFFAFDGGQVYALTVNEHSVFWGEKKIPIERIRHLANVPEDEDLIWERDGDANQTLPATGNFEISGEGIEHLRTHKKPVAPTVYEYFVDGIRYETDHASLTGAQITASVPGWNPANSLVLEGEGSAPDEVIHATTVVEFKGRKSPAQFASVPPATFGSV
ncbi:hypothetical protein ACW9YV_11330 [Paraburkholderia strydomiana]